MFPDKLLLGFPKEVTLHLDTIEDYLANALQTPEDWERSLDSRLVTALSSAVSFVPTVFPEYHNLKRERAIELYKAVTESGMAVNVYNAVVEHLKPMVEAGTLTKEEANNIARLASNPLTYSQINESMREMLDGAFDKVSPEQLEEFMSIANGMNKNTKFLTVDMLNDLDTKVESAVKAGGFADEEVPLFQALFRG